MRRENREAGGRPERHPVRVHAGDAMEEGPAWRRGVWKEMEWRGPVCAPVEADERGSTVEMGGMAVEWWRMGRYVSGRVERSAGNCM